jgi:hypothetical protein
MYYVQFFMKAINQNLHKINQEKVRKIYNIPAIWHH